MLGCTSKDGVPELCRLPDAPVLEQYSVLPIKIKFLTGRRLVATCGSVVAVARLVFGLELRINVIKLPIT